MHKTINILVVDDEVMIAEDIKETLQEVGYQSVYRAINFEQAADILQKNSIDLVMLDINLNEKQTGIDLAEHINQNYEIPFIFLTSYSSQETINQVKKTKPTAFLLKPYTESLLLASIEIALFNFYTPQNLSVTSTDEFGEGGTDVELVINGNLVIKDKKYFVKIPIDDILWFESDKNYIDVKTVDRKYTIRGSLKKIMISLPDSFVKCHRQYVVNLNYVTGFNSNAVTIGDCEIPISRNEHDFVLKRLKM